VNPSAFTEGPLNSVCYYQAAACGQCWQLVGPGGSANIQVTDCCAGYPGNQGCLTANPPWNCDWCAANDHPHFDLDWDSYKTVCGNQVDAGHCTISSATLINCPASAVADVTSTLSPGDASNSSPAWAIALIVVASLMLLLLLVAIVVLGIRIRNKEETRV